MIAFFASTCLITSNNLTNFLHQMWLMRTTSPTGNPKKEIGKKLEKKTLHVFSNVICERKQYYTLNL